MSSCQSVLVTGSSSGIGRAVSEVLARKGHTVFATMRHVKGKNAPVAEALQAMAQAEGLALHVIELDVTNDESVKTAVEQAIGIAGHLDVLINNAGVMSIGISEAMSVTELQQLFDVNVFGTFRVIQAVLPYMRQRGSGYLISVASTASRLIYPFMGMYCATKSAMSDVAEAFHYEVYSLGIDTTIIYAGGFNTDMPAKMVSIQENLNEQYGKSGMIAKATQNGFGPAMSSANHPNEMGEFIAELMEKPAGQRPLYEAIGVTSELMDGVNPARQTVQNNVISGMGLNTLLTRP